MGRSLFSMLVVEPDCAGICSDRLLATWSGSILSASMLAEAAKRKQYDELVKSELGRYLADYSSRFDIIVSGDALVYAGRLSELIGAGAASLKSGGYFLFTLESLPDSPQPPPYQLMPSGRFSHSAAYVRQVAKDAGLIVSAASPIIPRFEGGDPVHGLLIMAYRAP